MRVLVVDDTPTNLILTCSWVNRIADCVGTGVADPRAALQQCLDDAPDLVILDYLMPGLDGLAFLEALRARRALDELPVLMVTSASEREVRYRALELGTTDFLEKPLDRMEFQARLRNALTIRRAYLEREACAVTLEAEVDRATTALRTREREIIHRLARAAEFRDPETGAHILRMSHYACLVAETLGWSAARRELLLHAAPMHDVGKLGVPDTILLKPGRHTPEESAIMRTHATIGWQILRDSTAPMLQLAAEVAYSHHEKWDGSGYPRGLAGELIPESGRIVAVADVFDALTSVRPYKPAWEVERARAFIAENSGSHFEPRCVEAFLSRWDAVLAIRDRYRDEEPVAPPEE